MDIDRLEESALIRAISQRDEAALGELYDRFSRLVFSVAFHILGDRQSAEEVTLDVFTRVWQKADTYQADRARVSTWLTSMSRHRAIDLLRRENVRPMKHSISWAELTFEPQQAGQDPESSAHLLLQQQRVREALAALSAEQREVLALAYFKGYSHTEIAAALNTPLGTVKGRIRAGMQQLRRLLQDPPP